MDLNELFAKQKELDEYIIKEKGLEGQDLLDKKILALQVELGELANCWRGFKYWSKDQEPRTTAKCETCDGLGNDIYFTGSYDNGNLQECSEPCEYCDGTGDDDLKNPLLEEYVDCLRFLLSIGNDLGVNKIKQKHKHRYDIETAFIHLFMGAGVISTRGDSVREDNYKMTFSLFLRLGEMLGFTWEEIERAYYAKNKINFKC